MGLLLGHDVERLARHVEMSRRALNQQRETEHGSENWLRRLCRLIGTVRVMGFPTERYLGVVRAITDAAGVDIAERVPLIALSDLPRSATRSCSEALREASGAVSSMLDASQDGEISPTEAADIEREADEAIAQLHAIKKLARERARMGLIQGGAKA